MTHASPQLSSHESDETGDAQPSTVGMCPQPVLDRFLDLRLLSDGESANGDAVDNGDTDDALSSSSWSDDSDVRIGNIPIDASMSVAELRSIISDKFRDDAEYKQALTLRIAHLKQIPSKSLTLCRRAPRGGEVLVPATRHEDDGPLWSNWLPPPPSIAAKKQLLTPKLRCQLQRRASECVALMKETRRLDNGERILAAKAPYDLDYVAAAIALCCGWFAKGNGAPNLTVAASTMRSSGLPAPSTKATASVKAWMDRLQELDTALKEWDDANVRIFFDHQEAESLEVLRRGIGPRTVVDPRTRMVSGAGLFGQRLSCAVASGKLQNLERERCRLPICSGNCDGANEARRADSYHCTCCVMMNDHEAAELEYGPHWPEPRY